MPREALIQSLIDEGYLRTPSIIEAFKKIDRADFVPEEHKKDAYGNYPLLIGFGQTISQPLTVAFMLELLEPKAGEKILDIGTGSGWQAALLARLVGEQGKVIAVERIPELFMFAGKNISGYGFIDKGMVKLVNADGSKGYPAEAPFDKIIAAAAAARVPNAWKEQLRIGGRIVAPVRDSIVVLDKKGPNEFEERRHFGFSFVPLVTD
jgi:protein-L-isoaspartate(D-aspartate) O-methyltransferase